MIFDSYFQLFRFFLRKSQISLAFFLKKTIIRDVESLLRRLNAYVRKKKTPADAHSPCTAGDCPACGRGETAPQPAPESAQASAQAAEPAQTTKEADLTASISRNTVITGNIVSEDNLDIFGTVEGDVKSTAVVKVYGKITGDIDCATFVASGAEIKGNILAEKSAVLGANTVVDGNVRTGTLSVSGRVTGNVIATESAVISSTGAITGDITTPEMEARAAETGNQD